jgi:hypothetical protein
VVGQPQLELAVGLGLVAWINETYVNVNGDWRYVYRAVDQHGRVIDVLQSARRDAAVGVPAPRPAARGDVAVDATSAGTAAGSFSQL